jgi:hypothetical protein
MFSYDERRVAPRTAPTTRELLAGVTAKIKHLDNERHSEPELLAMKANLIDAAECLKKALSHEKRIAFSFSHYLQPIWEEEMRLMSLRLMLYR